MDRRAMEVALAGLGDVVGASEAKYEAAKKLAEENYSLGQEMIEASGLGEEAKRAARSAIWNEKESRIANAQRMLDLEISQAEESFRRKARAAYAGDDGLPFE